VADSVDELQSYPHPQKGKCHFSIWPDDWPRRQNSHRR
jgi:hypothetical protein